VVPPWNGTRGIPGLRPRWRPKSATCGLRRCHSSPAAYRGVAGARQCNGRCGAAVPAAAAGRRAGSIVGELASSLRILMYRSAQIQPKTAMV
jgi:hypothetical protein